MDRKRKRQAEDRLRALRRTEATYVNFVTNNRGLLAKVRKDIVEAEAELREATAARPGPLPHHDVRTGAADTIRLVLRDHLVMTGRYFRGLRVRHGMVGPLGGTSSQVSYEVRDPNGHWHAVVANVYVGDPPAERWAEQRGYEQGQFDEDFADGLPYGGY